MCLCVYTCVYNAFQWRFKGAHHHWCLHRGGPCSYHAACCWCVVLCARDVTPNESLFLIPRQQSLHVSCARLGPNIATLADNTDSIDSQVTWLFYPTLTQSTDDICTCIQPFRGNDITLTHLTYKVYLGWQEIKLEYAIVWFDIPTPVTATCTPLIMKAGVELTYTYSRKEQRTCLTPLSLFTKVSFSCSPFRLRRFDSSVSYLHYVQNNILRYLNRFRVEVSYLH